ncbi:hypothetical protein [Mumia sp. DW29H23]|uniref:hypothetical protein n=1 Tax=Mumia sp. DW29H23 TaxID=3421241 RepID=UPI003D68DCAA
MTHVHPSGFLADGTPALRHADWATCRCDGRTTWCAICEGRDLQLEAVAEAVGMPVDREGHPSRLAPVMAMTVPPRPRIDWVNVATWSWVAAVAVGTAVLLAVVVAGWLS